MNKRKERGKNSSPNCNHVVHTTFLQKKKKNTMKMPFPYQKGNSWSIIITVFTRFSCGKQKWESSEMTAIQWGTWFIIIAYSTSFHEAPNWRKKHLIHCIHRLHIKPGLLKFDICLFFFLSCIGTENTAIAWLNIKSHFKNIKNICPILANNCNGIHGVSVFAICFS